VTFEHVPCDFRFHVSKFPLASSTDVNADALFLEPYPRDQQTPKALRTLQKAWVETKDATTTTQSSRFHPLRVGAAGGQLGREIVAHHQGVRD
jgi:hypothetical protein